jgi:hypothetical protein
MEETIWALLGIEETGDERAIKRAYAARLKINSPEADSAGYMKLRAAYEQAKEHARIRAHVEELERRSPDEESVDLLASDPEPAAPAPAPAPVQTPQQLAIGALHEALTKGELARFLQQLEEIKAAGTFASLDDQYHFIGTIAVMIDEVSIEDSEWRSRVAQVLGAREHENIFTDNARYWYAYESLLKDYAEMRTARTHAHLDERHEDSAAPGYVHVYQVLTAPFDAERLSALTRSTSYHRLAERLLERAKGDSSIVIPFENREWWERTAMAGFHRPITDVVDPPLAQPEREDSSSGFPFWALWLVVFLIVSSARTCSSMPTQTISSRTSLERFQNELPMIIEQRLRGMEGYDEISKRLAQCDPQTRSEIFLQLYLARPYQPDPNADKTPLVIPAERTPRLSALLEKCTGPSYLDLGEQIERQSQTPD